MWKLRHPRPSPSPGFLVESAELLPLVARQESVIPTGELRSIPQLVLRDAGFVAAQCRIAMKLLPRNRVGFSTWAQKATESRYGIHDVPANLLDHKPLDRSEPLAICIVNGGALDVITFNQ